MRAFWLPLRRRAIRRRPAMPWDGSAARDLNALFDPRDSDRQAAFQKM